MRPIQIKDIASLWTWMGCALGGLLAVGCLVYSAWNQAPVNDEFGHFYAGLRYWQYADTATFNDETLNTEAKRQPQVNYRESDPLLRKQLGSHEV